MCNEYSVILILLLLSGAVLSKSYFCNISCTEEQCNKPQCGLDHTVCVREPCGPNKYCGQFFKQSFDDPSKELVVHLHNEFRHKIATGQDQQGGHEEASNMHVLSYSKELAFVAQCWANNCKSSSKSHDTCRSTSKFRTVGQNIYHRSANKSEDDVLDFQHLREALVYMYREIRYTTAPMIDSYTYTRKAERFTQMIWARTTEVGCGRARFGNDRVRMVLVCNYGVKGNVEGNTIYKRGKPCSECGNEPCNTKYPGLCGKIRPLSKDKWTSPFAHYPTSSIALRFRTPRKIAFWIFILLLIVK